MATRITLDSILPVLWRGLELDPEEKERPISKARFSTMMTSTETIVSPSVVKRMWTTLANSQFAVRTVGDVVFIDVSGVRARLYACGHRTLLMEHTHNTHIPSSAPAGGRVTQ